MRKYTIMIAIGILSVFAESACAETSRPIGKQSPEAVMKACADAGGTPILDRGITYGCTKENCDGKGGNCHVECSTSTGECYGSCPTCGQALRQYDLLKILKYSPGRAPGPGLLQPTPESSPHGPSGPGAPKPTAPPGGKLY